MVYQEPKQIDKDQYLYDPRVPVPSLFDLPNTLMPADQRPLANREDILVYQANPLTERVEVTGYPLVELYAASSAPDTDWFVRLIDVAPEGLVVDISMGVVRARYRNGFDKARFIKPGEVVKYTIRMTPTSYAFHPGHRIRLDITSSDFPNYDRNHNTATDQHADATLVTAKQAIYHGGEQATRIILPWVPNPVEQETAAEEEQAQAKPQKQEYSLHQATADGDLERIRLILSKGVDINAEDEKGKTPLHYGAETGKVEVVQLLVEAGADVNVMGKVNWPPLCVAVGENHITVVEYLIAHGADINAGDSWTALHEASSSGNVEMVELLIAKGADVDVGPWTPLKSAFNNGRRDIAEILIQNGADIQIEVPKGLRLLHYYSIHDIPAIIEQLLAKGAKVDERDDNYDFTALHYAVRFGNKEVAEVLIANDADIRAKDKWGYQPIHWAAYHDRPEIIELLIAKGADVNAKTSLGQTPLQLAKPRRNTAAIEVLRKHGAKEYYH